MSRSAAKEVRFAVGRAEVATIDGFFAGFPLDGDDRVVESVADPREGKRLFARNIVLAAVAGLPMVDDLERELLQRLDRRDHEEAADAVGATGTGDIVDIHVGHRRGDDLTVLVVNRIVQQRDVDRRAMALSARLRVRLLMRRLRIQIRAALAR